MKKLPLAVASTLLLMPAASTLALANQFNARSETAVNNLMLESVVVPPGAYVAAAHDRPDTIGELSGFGDEKGWGKFLNGTTTTDSPEASDLSDEKSPIVAAAVAVPESGTTALLVGMGLIGMTAAVRRRETSV